MIEALPPYKETRDSRFEWLGAVPAHWEVRRAKTIFSTIDRRSQTGEEELLTVSSKRGVVRRSETNVTMFKAASYVGHKLCWPGDLVVNSLWAWANGLGFAREHGLVSSAYSVYRPTPEFAEYANYLDRLLRSDAYNWEFTTRSKGVWVSRLQLVDAAFMDMPIILPPPEEQAAIVRFLADADRRIGGFIAAKQRLVGLLEEAKAAIVHRAVTKGLNPAVPTKASGVPWLGDIPAHWVTAPLGRRYEQCLGKMLDSAKIRGSSLIPYLRNRDVQWDRINISDLPEMDIPEAQLERYTVRPNDLLVCEGGEVGRAAIWREDELVIGFQKALHRLRPWDDKADLPDYLLLLLKTAVANSVFIDGHQSTIAHLTGDKLRAHRFAFPSYSEQADIVRHVASETATLDQAIATARAEIDLLREYRTRLISDVVTGKRDVRAAAAALPDITDDTPLPGLLADDSAVADDIAEGLEAA